MTREQAHRPAASQLATVALLAAFLGAWLVGIVVLLAWVGGAA